MNKLLTISRDLWKVIRGLLAFGFVIAPGVVAFLWLWLSGLGWELALMASLGVEFVWLIAFSFVVLVVEAWQERKRHKEHDLDEF